MLAALACRCVEHAEQGVQLCAEVVGVGALLDPPMEEIGFPEAGVVAVEQEQDAGQHHRGSLHALVLVGVCLQGQVVADGLVGLVTDHRLIQLRHELGGVDGGVLLFTPCDGLVPGQKQHRVEVVWHLVDRELDVACLFAEFVDADPGEVGDDDVLGELVLADRTPGEIVESLGLGLVQVETEGLGFAEEHPGLEHINRTAIAGGSADCVSLEQVYAGSVDIEAGQQIRPEGLGETRLSASNSVATPPSDTVGPVSRELS